ncbi:hypothetical protein B0A50_06383 [Salinomyces thailandicus]|uniref:Uncharacterized protein n=1 Tax=Salinomyces thailandicus TaxID=706561 RepID=A0A4U0TR45_9PEZI|nr:hypothetical protein B0A50_06383 [Salinomyces thailandica]
MRVECLLMFYANDVFTIDLRMGDEQALAPFQEFMKRRAAVRRHLTLWVILTRAEHRRKIRELRIRVFAYQPVYDIPLLAVKEYLSPLARLIRLYGSRECEKTFSITLDKKLSVRDKELVKEELTELFEKAGLLTEWEDLRVNSREDCQAKVETYEGPGSA